MGNCVVFLDIDGVMNCADSIQHRFLVAKDSEELHKADLPDPEHLLLLHQLLQKTKADLVLSSSWREDRLKELQELFGSYDIELKDVTPVTVPQDWLRQVRLCSDHQAKTWDRGAEIGYWLYQHPEYQRFVILDDDTADIVPYFPHNTIKTQFYGPGLTQQLVDQAIQILERN